MSKLCIVSHNFPKGGGDSSGKFIRDMLDLVDADYVVVGARGFKKKPLALILYCIKTWYTLLTKRDSTVIAFWAYPAALLALLAFRKYVVVAIGLDVYGICRRPMRRILFYPVFAKAERIVFIGTEPMLTFVEAYGSRFSYKTALAYFPVQEDYMREAERRYAEFIDGRK